MTTPAPLRPASARVLRRIAGVGLSVLAVIAQPTETRAEWVPNGTQVVPWSGMLPSLIGDGSGGALLVWNAGVDIRLERIGADGSVPPGLPGGGQDLYESLFQQHFPEIVPDDAGGMYVLWLDRRATGCHFGCSGLPYEIFLVRVLADLSVAPGWPAGGINLGAPQGYYSDRVEVCADGAGGVVVVWSERVSATDAGDIRARRYGPDGSSLWGAGPTPVCSGPDDQLAPSLAPDGTGGAIIVWQDERGAIGGRSLYAQHLSGAGVAQWTAQGRPLVSKLGVTAGPARMVASAGGGAFLSWNEAGGSSYLGHLTAAGDLDWWSDLGIGDADVRFAEDGTGGAFVTWSDGDIHLLRLGPDGSAPPGWIGPEIVCDAVGPQLDARVARDDAGGAYLLWRDDRTGGIELFATHIDASGNPAPGWPSNGSLVCTAAGTRTVQALARDGMGGAIALWDDQRDIPSEVLYAQRLVPAGLLPVPAPKTATFALSSPWPNPVRGALVAAFELPDASPARLELLDVTGRRIESRDVGVLGAGRHTITFRAGEVPPGVYMLRLARADGTRSARVAILPGSR